MNEYLKIVYKYRDWACDYHQRIIKNNELYLSSPKDFNDPYDCRIPQNFYELNTVSKKREFASRIVSRHSKESKKRGVNPDKKIEEIVQRLESDIEKVQSIEEKKTFEMQDKHYGVLSLSKIWDNILMWSHYSDNHKGFCVGFYENKLRESKFFGTGGEVNCTDCFPSINPLEEDLMKKAFAQTHNKAKDWGYEKEYRLTKLLFPEVPTKKDRVVLIEDDFFAEIILGLKMDDKHKREILDIAQKKRIPVYQAKKASFRFDLDREKVN